MFKLSPLPILLFTVITMQVTAGGYNTHVYALNANVFCISDTAPKPGFFKGLLQSLQFRKNSRAREQQRVLDIIARSGLKDSLEGTMKKLSAIDSSQRTAEQAKMADSIRAVLAAISSLKQQLAQLHRPPNEGPAVDNTAGDTTTPDEPSTDEQSVQSIIERLLNPFTADEQTNLNNVRLALQRGSNYRDTIKVNDTFRQAYQYHAQNRLSIIGLYPFDSSRKARTPDLRLVDELAWYSVSFAGSTGCLTGAEHWIHSTVLDTVAAAGVRLSLCVQGGSRQNIRALLGSPSGQRKLIGQIITALDIRQARTVNILLDDPPPNSAAQLTSFIKALSDSLRQLRPAGLLSLRIPAYSTDDIYDLVALNDCVDRFLVNFAAVDPNLPGPLAPLAGKGTNNLQTCLSRYLNFLKAPIAPAKLVVCLPYFGVRWNSRTGARKPAGRSYAKPDSITYAVLRSDSQYRQPSVYETLSATQRIDLRNKTGAPTGTLWYDDEITLAAKYDYIQKQRLGGILIESLGDDGSYGELWDVRVAKLAQVVPTVTDIKGKKKKSGIRDDWEWSWTYLNAKIEQYFFLLSYPCETKFPRVLVRKWEEAGVRNNDRNEVRKEAEFVITIISILMALLVTAGGWYLINRIRRVGENWKGIKPLAAILTVLSVLLTVGVFMWLFFDKNLPYFGVSDDKSDCFDFPFGTLFLIVLAGILLGILLARFLIFRLLKRNDIP